MITKSRLIKHQLKLLLTIKKLSEERLDYRKFRISKQNKSGLKYFCCENLINGLCSVVLSCHIILKQPWTDTIFQKLYVNRKWKKKCYVDCMNWIFQTYQIKYLNSYSSNLRPTGVYKNCLYSKNWIKQFIFQLWIFNSYLLECSRMKKSNDDEVLFGF